MYEAASGTFMVQFYNVCPSQGGKCFGCLNQGVNSDELFWERDSHVGQLKPEASSSG